MDYTALVALPSPQDINSGYHSPANGQMVHLLGRPGNLTRDCSPITNKDLKKRMVTKALPGGLRVTGLDVAVRSLAAVFSEIQEAHPNLLPLLGTAGMLCCRAQRGSSSLYSNHSWGTACDLTVGGLLSPQGATHIPMGLVAAYPYFHGHGWFWGAEFSTSDPMHFELSYEALVGVL